MAEEWKPCPCSGLTRTTADHGVIADHHPHCPKYDIVRDMKAVIACLVKGMEAWSADEDGIHPDAWDAYRHAKYMVEGKIIKETNNV